MRASPAARAAVNAALTVASLALCFGALEAGLRAFGPERGDWYAAGAARTAFLREHVHRNALGFRDREFGPKQPNVPRILAVGDSFTFGDGIPDAADTWPRVLEASLASAGVKAEVLNVGVPGTNTAFQRHLLATKGYALAPDRIVLAFVPNDPEPPGANTNAVPTRLNPPLIPAVGLDRALSRSSYAYAWLRAKKNELLERTGLKETYADYVRGLYRPGPSWDDFVAEARVLVAEARLRRVAITVVLFPLFFDLEHDPFGVEMDRAAAVFREAGADVLDLRPVFAGHATSDLWIAPTDAHPDELAHRLAGEAIARHLVAARVGG